MIDEDSASLLKEIVSGFSIIEVCGIPAYLKHYSDYEISDVSAETSRIIKECVSKGLPNEKEAIQNAIKNGSWSKKEEDDYKKQKILIETLIESKEKIILPSQKEIHQKEIDKERSNLLMMEKDRRESIGRTAEDFANVKGYEKFVISLIFKDKELRCPFFSLEEMEDIDQNFVKDIFDEFKRMQYRFSDEVISEMVVSPFFYNYLNLSEESSRFFDKPIFYLTSYQVKLLSISKTFLNIFKNYSVPKNISNDPKKILSFINSENNKNKKSSSKGGTKENEMSGYFGATREDLDIIDPDSKKINLMDIIREKHKKGEKVTAEDLAKLS